MAGSAETPRPIERWNAAAAEDVVAAGLRDVDTWWDRFGRMSGCDWDVNRADDCFAAVDVIVSEGAYVFVSWLPGIRSSDLRVVLHEHLHTVDGRAMRWQRIGIVVHRVRALRGLCYCATVPASVDIEHVEAQLRDGMLIVRMPIR